MPSAVWAVLGVWAAIILGIFGTLFRVLKKQEEDNLPECPDYIPEWMTEETAGK